MPARWPPASSSRAIRSWCCRRAALRRVKSIVTYDGELARAFPPMSVTVCLEDEVDVSRGNMLVPPSHPPHVTRCIDARLVWMGNQPLDLRRQYIIKHTTQSVKAQVRLIRYRVNVNTLERHPASELNLNEIGTVVIDTHSPLFVDQYRRNRMTGSFVMVDPISNATVAAGMVTGRDPRVAIRRRRRRRPLETNLRPGRGPPEARRACRRPGLAERRSQSRLCRGARTFRPRLSYARDRGPDRRQRDAGAGAQHDRGRPGDHLRRRFSV